MLFRSKLVFLVFGRVVVVVGVVAGVLVLVLVVRLLVFGFIGLGLAGMRFLPESFPVTESMEWARSPIAWSMGGFPCWPMMSLIHSAGPE